MRADSDPWPEARTLDTSAGMPEVVRLAVDHIHPPGEGRPWFATAAFPQPRAGGHRLVQPK
jgi:hypothetical protein